MPGRFVPTPRAPAPGLKQTDTIALPRGSARKQTGINEARAVPTGCPTSEATVLPLSPTIPYPCDIKTNLLPY